MKDASADNFFFLFFFDSTAPTPVDDDDSDTSLDAPFRFLEGSTITTRFDSSRGLFFRIFFSAARFVVIEVGVGVAVSDFDGEVEVEEEVEVDGAGTTFLTTFDSTRSISVILNDFFLLRGGVGPDEVEEISDAVTGSFFFPNVLPAE